VLLLDSGGNLAAPAATLAYTIEDRGDGPRVEWQAEPMDITAEQALAAEQAAYRAPAEAPERRAAEEWLEEALAEGPVSAVDVKAAARKAGISPRTLDRVKAGLRVQSQRRGFGCQAVYYWTLA
jgi:hypothetical protein